RELHAKGASVVVLEARDRVGGRTLSREAGAATVDLGAQWLGPTQHRMRALVDELGIATFPTFHKGRKILRVGDKTSTYSGSIPKLSPLNLALLQRTISSVDRRARRIDAHQPWLSADAAALDSQTLESWKRRQIPSRTVREVFDVAARVVFGAEPAELSLLYFLYYVRSAGGLMDLIEIERGAQETRFVDGAQQVAVRLAGPLGDRVITAAPVRSIRQSKGGCEVEVTGREAVHAKRVIVAVPPALCGRIGFEPALPGLRDELTQRMPMGATIKAHLLYEHAFWRRRGLSGEAVVTGGPVSAFFDNTSHDGAQPGLLGFVVGAAARELGALSPEQRRARVIAAAVDCFSTEAASPVAYVDKDWSADPWSRGCPTANLPPGVLTVHGSVLREPVGRVHWAGTETATRWAGYMEGAVASGERAALEVLELL
ncbi:MAG: flavin monoamine oxidase family protein, partial [Actinomycetota bacterium]